MSTTTKYPLRSPGKGAMGHLSPEERTKARKDRDERRLQAEKLAKSEERAKAGPAHKPASK